MKQEKECIGTAEIHVTAVEPSYEILKMPDASQHVNVLKFIEHAGRLCYKSETKITDDSYNSFISMIKSRGHSAVFEQCNFVMGLTDTLGKEIEDNINTLSHLSPSFAQAVSYIHLSVNYSHGYVLSGSATAFNSIIREVVSMIGLDIIHFDKADEPPMFLAILVPIFHLQYHYPELIDSAKLNQLNDMLEIKKDIITVLRLTKRMNEAWFLSNEEVDNLPASLKSVHKKISVQIVCDRGIANEIVRHRVASYLQESTRYCNYNNRGFEYIIPSELRVSGEANPYVQSASDVETIHNRDLIRDSVRTAFTYYSSLINQGVKPQIARCVLPLATKTEIIVTASLAEWQHIFNLRDHPAAHPDMVEIMKPLHQDMIKLYPDVIR